MLEIRKAENQRDMNTFRTRLMELNCTQNLTAVQRICSSTKLVDISSIWSAGFMENMNSSYRLPSCQQAFPFLGDRGACSAPQSINQKREFHEGRRGRAKNVTSTDRRKERPIRRSAGRRRSDADDVSNGLNVRTYIMNTTSQIAWYYVQEGPRLLLEGNRPIAHTYVIHRGELGNILSSTIPAWSGIIPTAQMWHRC